MGINFTLKDSVVEDSEILTRVNGPMEDTNIMICGVKLTRSKLFTDLNIPKFCATIQNQNMDSEEKASMQNVLEKKADRKAFIDALIQHLISFAEGVAASIIASCIFR